jgi:hypothetical protein
MAQKGKCAMDDVKRETSPEKPKNCGDVFFVLGDRTFWESMSVVSRTL